MKPHIILQLEKELNIKFNEVKTSEIIEFKRSEIAEYSIDNKNRVNGLSITTYKFTDIVNLISNNDKELNYLTHLNLHHNDIQDISGLIKFKNLTHLNLGRNLISDISVISNLEKLKNLDLSFNFISDIASLQNLELIEKLDLQKNQITEISPIKKLCKLKELYFGNNSVLENLNISVLKNFKELTILQLNRNEITDISALEKLVNLTELELNDNKITDISSLKNLKKLKKLTLKNNLITKIPSWFSQFPKMEIQWTDNIFNDANLITLENNPIENPPIEIIKQGKDAIKNYFEELEKGTVNLYETKLLLVGYGAVGKTSLMKRLVYDEYNENEVSTEGIDIKRWSLKTKKNYELKINIWDFGGQEIYHSTHQFFLSKRSIYLLVWDARIDRMMPNLASFDYWLHIVSLLSKNSPIIIVQNKIDQRTSLVDEKYMKDYFPNIVGFYKVSAKDKTGINELKTVIQNEIQQLPHIGEQLPKVWIDIRDNLKKKQQNYVKLDEYLSVCNSYNIDYEQAIYLSNYFHDLGIFLHFQDNDILRNIIFLNPEWATKAVYKVIDTKEIVDNGGKFNYSQLKDIWKDYPDDKFSFLIELMKKFELCFQLPNKVDYIVPELLPPTQPDNINWDNTGNFQFEYRYKFVPAGVITRLIVRMHNIIKNNIFWLHGLAVKQEDTEAIITINKFERYIRVKVKGKNKQDLFGIIRYEINNIHKTLKNPPVELMTHCICDECNTSEKPEFYAFKQLNKYLDKGKKTITCPKSVKEVSINKLLGKINGEGNKKSFFEYLLVALKQLQGLSLSIQKYEDSRNSFVATMLTNKNYRVKDQTKWGIAKTQPGEIDIKIEDENGVAFAICEAFNLHNFDKSKIKNHINKIFNYDANGLPENYIIVYSEKNFIQTWQKYQTFIQTIDYKHKFIDFTDISNNPDINTDIKVGIARHKRNDRTIKIYHFFVKLITP